MLKQFKQYQIDMAQMQPPSGGCVLKQYGKFRLMVMGAAAFGRLCVETTVVLYQPLEDFQPPSGGCVLKHCRLLCFALS